MDMTTSGRSVLFNNDQLIRLITNLHTLTGIWANIFDANGRDIQIRHAHSDFCHAVKSVPGGNERCVACDAEAVKRCRENHATFYSYNRCALAAHHVMSQMFSGKTEGTLISEIITMAITVTGSNG